MKRKLCLILSAALICTSVLTACDNKDLAEATPSPSAITSETAPSETEPSEAGPAVDKAYLDEAAKVFMSNLMNGKYEDCYATFDESLASQDTAEMLRNDWESMVYDVGSFESEGKTDSIDDGSGYTVYDITNNYESEGIMTRVVFSQENGKVAYVNFSYAAKTVQTNAKDLPKGVAEKNLTVGKGTEFELNAKLTYPANTKNEIPAVVLVHRYSGGMDEAIFTNRVFKDIAYGLAQKGIAVLRYDTRAYTYKDAVITGIEEETINDAVIAKQAVLDQKDVKISDVYVVGHYIGAMLAPRIAEEGGYDGMVLLAGSPRSLIDIIYDGNLNYLDQYEGTDEEMASMLEMINTEYEDSKNLMSLTDEELQTKTYMNISAKYLKSIESHPASEYLKKLKKPALILQGDKDCEISPEKDYLAFEPFAKENENIEMKLYEGLNNLFMPSTMDPPSTQEYSTPSQVDDKVLEDISTWLKAN